MPENFYRKLGSRYYFNIYWRQFLVLQELQSRLEMLERENTELKAGSEMISQETHSQLLSEMRASHEEEIKQAVAKVTGAV